MSLDGFLLGVLTAGFATAGLFFVSFWQKTRDRFFALFAASFFFMSLNQVGFLIAGEIQAYSVALYSSRLLAFALILVAILDKNRR